MIIDCLGDTHGFLPTLPGGDLLIVAGDLTAHDRPYEHVDFLLWLEDQDYTKKIYIAGNHDNNVITPAIPGKTVEYLQDSGTEFEGLKIWGMPWTKKFLGMNPNARAFTVANEEQMAEKCALIPDDIDIIITHSPPYSHLDFIPATYKHVGSTILRHRIREIKPRLCAFGHVHECGGQTVDYADIKYVNCSHIDEHYQPINEPVRVVL